MMGLGFVSCIRRKSRTWLAGRLNTSTQPWMVGLLTKAVSMAAADPLPIIALAQTPVAMAWAMSLPARLAVH